jgi:hypothetical protein
MKDEERPRRRVVLHRKMLRDWSASDPVERTVWLSELEYTDWLRLLRRADEAAAGSPERTAALNELRCLAELRWHFPDAVYGEPDQELAPERAVTPSEAALSTGETALDDGPELLAPGPRGGAAPAQPEGGSMMRMQPDQAIVVFCVHWLRTHTSDLLDLPADELLNRCTGAVPVGLGHEFSRQATEQQLRGRPEYHQLRDGLSIRWCDLQGRVAQFVSRSVTVSHVVEAVNAGEDPEREYDTLEQWLSLNPADPRLPSDQQAEQLVSKLPMRIVGRLVSDHDMLEGYALPLRDVFGLIHKKLENRKTILS